MHVQKTTLIFTGENALFISTIDLHHRYMTNVCSQNFKANIQRIAEIAVNIRQIASDPGNFWSD
jgi:hypothetical protein